MNIEFIDCGPVSTIVVRCTIFETRKHDRVINTTLHRVPGTVSERHGVFFLKTYISGYTAEALRAYQIALEENQQ